MKKIILAGNHDEYIRCCHQRNLNPKEVPYITEPSQVEQIHESINPIYFGTFYDNPKYPEIERIMASKGIRDGGRPLKHKLERIDLK